MNFVRTLQGDGICSENGFLGFFFSFPLSELTTQRPGGSIKGLKWKF